MRRAHVIAVVVALALTTSGAARAGPGPGPTVTLTKPANGALLTRQPTFSGTGTAVVANSQVTVHVCSGTVAACTSGTVENVSAGVDQSSGNYSTAAAPPLADGAYTAEAEQDDALGDQGFSSPVQFRVKVHAPAVTLAHPIPGSRLTAPMLSFDGRAGTALGDSSRVTVLLYRGGSASGSPLATLTTTASGRSWSSAGPPHLAPGRYTAVATQRDDAGHTGRSAPSTFRIVPLPRVIGPTVTLDRAGVVSLRIGCTAASGSCSGDVLILTVGRFQPVPGGPVGHLRVMFAFVSIPAGQAQLVRRAVLSEVARVLRRHPGMKLRVTAALSPSGRSVTALRRLLLR